MLDRYHVDIPQRAVQSFCEVGKYLKYKGKKESVEPRGLEPLTSTCCNFIPQMKICCSVSLWDTCDSRCARAADDSRCARAAERRLEFLASLE
ncbi:MAG: hypothetical protein V3T00_05190, partial [bacterium]